MIRRHKGFTIVELMIAMVIFIVLIAAASNIFTGLLIQFKQQSKIAETNIEGMAGLEIMRFDVEQAGYGLPWNVDTDGDRLADADWAQLAAYCEAASVAAVPGISPNPSSFNDGVTSVACTTAQTGGRAPRAVVAGNNVGPNNSDYLVIKASNITTATNDAANKWTYISNTGAQNVFMTAADSPEEDLLPGERVIVILPSRGTAQRVLLTNGGVSFALFNTDVAAGFPTNLQPLPQSFTTHLVYGVDTDTNLRMPFNRADYYISTATPPQRCAASTGVLIKSIIRQDNGAREGMPLLDCVADMQVSLFLDMDDDGTAGTISAAGGTTIQPVAEATTVADVQATLANAALLRQRLKEIRVYILSHEGQKDTAYTFTGFTGGVCATCIRVGALADLEDIGSDFDLSTIADFRNYRWKIYQMIVTPYNLR